MNFLNMVCIVYLAHLAERLIEPFMQAERLKASLKEIDDLKAAPEEYTLTALFDWQKKTTRANDTLYVRTATA